MSISFSRILLSTGLYVLPLLFSQQITAQEAKPATPAVTENKAVETEKKEGALNPVEIIMEHISDAHEWHILSTTDAQGKEHAIAIPLPVIVLSDGHLDVFMSTAFEEGAVVRGDRTYFVEKNIIKEKNGKQVLDFSITKNVAALFVSILALIWIFTSVASSYKKKGVPGGKTSFLEPLILFVRDDIAVPNIGKDKADKFLPYLLTVFFFIWINNIFGLIPVFPFGANVTGNIAVTLVLATITFIITNINGSKSYWSHMLAMPGIPKVLWIIMTPVELLGIFTKPIALMIRLFANITAGHILILSLVMLIFIYKSLAVAPVSVVFMVFLSLLEVLVAALQAYIFTLLSALFIGSAVVSHDHGHDEHHH